MMNKIQIPDATVNIRRNQAEFERLDGFLYDDAPKHCRTQTFH